MDATFLELEQADETAHMHIGAILVFDPPPSGERPSLEELSEQLSARLAQLPRYRQRLATPRTGGLSWPEWEEDPAFDVSTQVGHAALPAPGGEEELLEWVSAFFSARLDRRHPLWEMVLVEGLEGGRWAVATKTHHCMVDGVGSVDTAQLLLDVEPRTAAERAADLHAPAAEASPLQSEPATAFAPLRPLARGAARLVSTDAVTQAAHIGARSVAHPRDALHRARALVELLLRDEVMAAPHTSLNQPIGTRRRFDVLRVPLSDVRHIKNALGGTVNDVVLAVVTGGLRELLEQRGEPPPPRGLRAMVPVNVRAAAERLALGNRISTLFVELPVAEADPLARLRKVSATAGHLKSGSATVGGETLLELTSLAPPVLHSTLAQALFASRLFNVTVTNVPGPQQTLYSLGAPLREIHPLVPLAAEHAVGVAIVSYDGNVFFGVIADRDTVPDMLVLMAGLERSLQELKGLAEAAEVAPDRAAVPKRAAAPKHQPASQPASPA